MNSTKALLKLQEADILVLRARKSLKELPQKPQLEKLKGIREKLLVNAQAAEGIRLAIEERINELQAESDKLGQDIANDRHVIETTSDYRVISSVTRDMEGAVKRQEKVDFELAGELDKLDRNAGLAKDVAEKLELVEKRILELVDELKAAQSKIAGEIEAAQAKHDEYAASVDPALLKRYLKLAEQKGGIGAARLNGDHCSVCSIEFQDGQIARLMNGPAVSECPNCGRLIVVREDEE